MKTKSIIYMLLIGAFGLCGLNSCKDDDLSATSIYTDEVPTNSIFDKWLVENFVNPYNVEFNWKYDDKNTNPAYNVVPCDSTKAVALAIMTKHMWFDTYGEVVGNDFLKSYSPRILQLIGSPQYSSNEELVLGYAENGIKVNLFNVNAIDVDNPWINVENWDDTDHNDLNHWFFHTMHHEFGHILNQKKDYNQDFKLVSAGEYKTSDWVNLDDADAPALGFVSGYASSEANEDFVETYSKYITLSENAWNNLLDAAVVVKTNEDGDTVRNWNATTKQYEIQYDYSKQDKILQKLEYVRDYMKGSWGIDIDKLRAVILRRSGEVNSLDLRNLK